MSVDDQETYYQVLGVQETASADEIKVAYRNLAHQFHPDKVAEATKGFPWIEKEATERFVRIKEAHDVLTDENKRSQYDELLKAIKEDEQEGEEPVVASAPHGQPSTNWTGAAPPRPSSQPPPPPPSRPSPSPAPQSGQPFLQQTHVAPSKTRSSISFQEYRRRLFWVGIVLGGLFGFLLFTLLPNGHERDGIAVVAGLAGWLAVLLLAAWLGSWGGVIGGLFGPAFILGFTSVFSLSAFSGCAWASIISILLYVLARPLFDRKTGGKGVLLIWTAVAFGLVSAIVLGGIVLSHQVSGPFFDNPASAPGTNAPLRQGRERASSTREEQRPRPTLRSAVPTDTEPVGNSPLKVGVVTTCAEAYGWKNYVPKDAFYPGKDFCLYAEALNVNRGGRIDVVFSGYISGYGLRLPFARFTANTSDPSCEHHWTNLHLPPGMPPGTYVARVGVHDYFTGQDAYGSSDFTVLPIGPSGSGTPMIASMTPIYARANQTVTITGRGFGYQAPYNGDSQFIMISDLSGYWNAGNQDQNDLVTLSVAQWTDTRIVIQGFTGSYGNWHLNPGDQVRVEVWNPQTRLGPATATLTVSPDE